MHRIRRALAGLGAVAAMSVMAVGPAAATAPSLSLKSNVITFKAKKGVLQPAKVTVKGADFPDYADAGSFMVVTLCSTAVLTTPGQENCDISHATLAGNSKPPKKGKVTFKALVDPNYSDANGGHCSHGDTCVLSMATIHLDPVLGPVVEASATQIVSIS